MRSLRAIRLLLCMATLALILPIAAVAQDDPDEVPLGDVARSLRKNAPPPAAMPVIDDDTLPQVMESADHGRSFRSRWPFLLMADSKVHDPDVTCNLSFTVNVKSLIARQFDQMELPPTELARIDAKALIEGDALNVTVFNGTQWHLSELSIAFTVVKKAGDGTQDRSADSFEQVRPEKKPDLTMIYRIRAAGAPWERTVFSSPLSLSLEPNEEWHWAIVQVKGYPPNEYLSKDERHEEGPSGKAPVPSVLPVSNVTQETAAPSVPSAPQ